MKSTPNLFSYATSELSQDAFISWLLAWADDKYKQEYSEMNAIARNLLEVFFAKHGLGSLPEKIEITVNRQYKNIDVYCTINNEFFLIIEDKVGTKQHSKQLERYKELIEKELPEGGKLLLIYYQTGNQSSYAPVEAANYVPINRSHLLAVFESAAGVSAQKTNNILEDYVEHLRKLEDRFLAYKNKPEDKWGYYAWQGFFTELQVQLNQGNWKHVSNPAGGFQGFWWSFLKFEDHHIYLQVEANKKRVDLVFKVNSFDKDNRKAIRNKASKKIIELFDGSDFKVRKPARFALGKTMTVAVLKEEDFRCFDSSNILNIDKTVNKLKEIQRVLEGYQPD